MYKSLLGVGGRIFCLAVPLALEGRWGVERFAEELVRRNDGASLHRRDSAAQKCLGVEGPLAKG